MQFGTLTAIDPIPSGSLGITDNVALAFDLYRPTPRSATRSAVPARLSLITGNTAAISLTAANTYTAATSVNAGQLTLEDRSLGGTAVTVGNGSSGSPILLISGNYTIGTAAAGSLDHRQHQRQRPGHV